MTHIARRFSPLILALGLLLSPAPLRAAPPVAIAATARHDYVFAQRMIFTLDATSDARIVRAVVSYQSDRGALQQVEAAFEPGASVHAEVTLELRGGAIPPFSTVSYWWDVSDEAGQRQTTPRASFAYVDNRFEWQTVSDRGVSVYWTDGDAAFGEAVLDTALEALPAIADEIGVTPPAGIDIYVYPSREELISVLRLGGREWAAGQARPELGVALVDVPATADAPVNMRRLVPHELTHLLIYQAAQPNYASVPAWLDEGLAVANEVSPDPALAVALDQATREDRLFPFAELCAPFPSDAGQARLAYAQSGSLMQFVRDRYGAQRIRDLLKVYREQASCGPGVERALNITLAALDNEWRNRPAPGPDTAGAVVETSAPWLALWLIISLALLPILGGLPLLARRKAR